MYRNIPEEFKIFTETADVPLPEWGEGHCYSGYELILLATELEKQGWLFYRHAHSLAKTDRVRKIFKRIADEELEHIRMLHKNIKPLVGMESETTWQNDEEVSQYLLSSLGPEIFPEESTLRRDLAGLKTEDDAIAYCLKGENASIVFYEGMLKGISCDSGREALQRILEMEREHAETLSKLKE